jgi:hypothetical protein
MAPTTSQLLASRGVTLQQAHDWVLSHLAAPQTIVDAARQFGLTNAQLGEIAGGFSAADVKAFFGARGIDCTLLDTPVSAFALPDNLSALASLVTPDNHAGALSTASLHARVAAATGEAAYGKAFADADFESQFYGTLVNALKSIDLIEAARLASFAQANRAALASDPLAVLSQGADLLVAVLTTPARFPVLGDSMVADTAVAAGTYYVQLVGQPQAAVAVLQGLLGALPH